MDTIILFKYFTFFLATYFILKYAFLGSKLKKLPPSPFLSFPIIGHLYLFKKPLHRFLANVATKHGSILYLRFGSRPIILLSNPSGVEESLGRNDVFVNRPRLLPGKYNGNNYTTITWAPYGALWKNQRRISAVEILSPQRLQILSRIRADAARFFIIKMMKLIGNTKDGVVEMKSIIFGLTLDNLTRMIIGKINYEHKDEYLRGFDNLVEESSSRSGISNLEDFLPILKWFRPFWGTNNEKILKKTKDGKEEMMKALLEEHRKLEKDGNLGEDRKRSMLHVLLSLQKEDPHYYTDELIGYLILVSFYC